MHFFPQSVLLSQSNCIDIFNVTFYLFLLLSLLGLLFIPQARNFFSLVFLTWHFAAAELKLPWEDFQHIWRIKVYQKSGHYLGLLFWGVTLQVSRWYCWNPCANHRSIIVQCFAFSRQIYYASKKQPHTSPIGPFLCSFLKLNIIGKKSPHPHDKSIACLCPVDVTSFSVNKTIHNSIILHLSLAQNEYLFNSL